MGKRNKRPQSQQEKPDLLKGLANLSLEEIIALQKSTPALLQSKLQQMSNSGDVEAIMKANLYFNTASQNDTRMKSVFFDPNDVGDSGREYKDSKGILSFETLRRMGDIFIVRSVVNTRVEQVQNFLHFNTDEQKAGYTIRKKKQLYQEDKVTEKLKREDQEKIAYIVKFLENGGLNEKWANFDTFQDFGRKLIFDSLTLDQMAFEITRDRGNDLAKFRAVDASLIRLLDSADPKMREAFERYRYKGYLPRYCMAWQGQILQNPVTKEHVIYYPWELGYGVRNKSTSIYRNGYGTSELETLVNIITWMLWGFEYNSNFFSKGSQPKGFINIKNANIDNASLNEFRQAWTQTMRGTSNSHRTPILQGIDMEWIDLQKLSNRDMEFNDWVKFLIIITCSVYRIDPSELGFQFKEQANIFGQDGQHERLEHSKEKGLKPLLIFFQNIINKYIVEEIDEDFEFAFTGIEVEDASKQIELDKKKSEAGFVSFEDMFEKYSGRPYNEETDTILNTQFQQAQQIKQQAEMYAEPVPGEEGGETEDPFAQYKSIDNPILGASLDYINKHWGKK